MKEETDSCGLAVPKCSPWYLPCLLVPKSEKSYLFCRDYRKVNALTEADSFPLSRMDDCVDQIRNAKFVTKLDLLKGYWQVPVTPRASEISAFTTPDRFLQYTVIAVRVPFMCLSVLGQVSFVSFSFRPSPMQLVTFLLLA